jgi:hypothetical protein
MQKRIKRQGLNLIDTGTFSWYNNASLYSNVTSCQIQLNVHGRFFENNMFYLCFPLKQR